MLCLLVLDGCDATVLDIVDSACTALEIFGYNSEDLMIPAVNLSMNASSATGLREFYTRKNLRPESAATVLPCIRRNMASLEKITMEIVNRDSEGLATMYTDLELENLKSLTFWDSIGGILPLILRPISSSITLTHLSVFGSNDVPGLVNILIAMPPIESLELTYVWDIAGSTTLVHLFNAYARDSQYAQTCGSIKLRCFRMTDECITALAGVRTLRSITLADLRNTISPIAVSGFFSRLIQNSTRYLSLSEMDCITDQHISTIGDIHGLESLHLDNLRSITDAGIIAMADKKPALQRFTIANCDWITGKAFRHARQNLKYAVPNFDCT